jgi:hypothetical protein
MFYRIGLFAFLVSGSSLAGIYLGVVAQSASEGAVTPPVLGYKGAVAFIEIRYVQFL